MEFEYKATCKNCNKEIALSGNMQWFTWIHLHNMSMYCNEDRAEPVKDSVQHEHTEARRG